MPPTGDLACNPGMCSRLRIELATLWFTGQHSIYWTTSARTMNTILKKKKVWEPTFLKSTLWFWAKLPEDTWASPWRMSKMLTSKAREQCWKQTAHKGPEIWSKQSGITRALSARRGMAGNRAQEDQPRSIRACLMADKESGINSVIPQHPVLCHSI